MKVIFRADDVGYTYTHNLGTWKSIDEGVVTSCDTMLDAPGFEDACAHLKNYPWLSIGWHAHLWGSPVLSPSEVPSLVNEQGRFKWRHNMKLMNEVDYDEAVRELRAEVERCRDLLGRIPDTCGFRAQNTMYKALLQVCDEYGIVHDFEGGTGWHGEEIPVDEKWRHLNIREHTDREHKHTKGLDVVHFPDYHPLGSILEMPIDDSIIWMRSQHPGYLDDYVLAESSCTIPRVRDVETLCAPELKAWIVENKIELVNYRDALYGTSEYQDHLKEIDSPLWVGNMA